MNISIENLTLYAIGSWVIFPAFAAIIAYL